MPASASSRVPSWTAAVPGMFGVPVVNRPIPGTGS